MTSNINYDELRTKIETQLSELKAEKVELQQKFQIIERRIESIDAHQTPLLRLLDSLDELRKIGSLDETFVEHFDNATAIEEYDTIKTNYEDNSPINTEVEIQETSELSENLIEAEIFDSSNDGEINYIDESVINEYGNADVNQSDNSVHSNEISVSPKSDTDEVFFHKSSDVDVVEGFDVAEFYKKFPHITPAHPVHLFARYLLEYFGFGLKLSQIARLVEALGYKHGSRNFTDSVHSALKNKRKTTGEFHFNVDDRVWELSNWQKGEKNVVKTLDKAVKTDGKRKISGDSQTKTVKKADSESKNFDEKQKSKTGKPKPIEEVSNSSINQESPKKALRVIKKNSLAR